ncbi:MAG: AAA family ATPase, partial [Dehalococcoidia bacterium]
FVVLISGLPGTGKTCVGRALARRLPLSLLETDALRKSLFPVPMYSAEESVRLFQACHLLMEELLRKGVPVLLDGTNLVERQREHVYGISDRLNVKLVIVRVTAPEEEVRWRLRRRLGKGQDNGHSDADWEVYKKMRPREEVIRRNHYVIDTSKDVTPVIDKIVREVNRWLKG